MADKKKIWFDITNVPHVNFLLPIIRKYENEMEMVFTVRDFAETKSLFEKRINRPYIEAGQHQGGNKLKKLLGLMKRIIALHKQVPQFDIKISVGGDSSSPVAWWRKKMAVTFVTALRVGKLPTSRRYNQLPLLRSSPGGFARSWPYRTYPYTFVINFRNN